MNVKCFEPTYICPVKTEILCYMIHYDVKSVETSSLNKSEEVVTFIDCLLFPYYFVVQVKCI